VEGTHAARKKGKNEGPQQENPRNPAKRNGRRNTESLIDTTGTREGKQEHIAEKIKWMMRNRQEKTKHKNTHPTR